MDFSLIGLLGAVAEYWGVPYLSAVVDSGADEDGGGDILLAEIVITGTGADGIVSRHLRLRARWFNLMVLDWRQGLSLARIRARFPVIMRAALSAPGHWIDMDFPQSPAMREGAASLLHGSLGIYQGCLLHESGHKEGR